MKPNAESRLKLKPAQRARLLTLARNRKASRKDREWAKKQLAESDLLGDGAPSGTTIPKRPVGFFAIRKDDPMIALANSAGAAFDPSVCKVGFLGPEFGGLGLFSGLPNDINRRQFQKWLAKKKRKHTAESYALRDLAGFRLHLGFKADRAKKRPGNKTAEAKPDTFARIRALRSRLSLQKGGSAKDLINDGRRI